MALGLVLGIAQAAVGFAQAKQQADDQNAAYERNWKASLAAMRDDYDSVTLNTLQEREVASSKLIEKRIEAMKAKATASTAAGEGGVTGLSVDALVSDLEAQHARQAHAIVTNYENKRLENMQRGKQIKNQTISRINSVKQARNPSPLPFILQGIGSGLGAMS